MLRISVVPDHQHERVLKLEGKLLAPWLGELSTAIQRVTTDRLPIAIDLSNVSFVDRPGTIALRELICRGIVIRGCSPLVTELLKENLV